MAIHHQLNPHLWPSSKHYILENCHGQPTPRRNSRPNMSLGLMKTHWFPLIRTLFNPYFWGVGYVRWGLGWLAMNNATFAPRTQGFPHMTPLNSNGTWIKLSLIPRKKKTLRKGSRWSHHTTICCSLAAWIWTICGESVGHSMELPKTDLLLFGWYYPRLPNILWGDIWTQVFGCLGLHNQMVMYNEPL